MSSPVVTALPDETIATAASRMGDKGVGSVVIVDGRRPVGISLYHGGRLSILLDGHHRAVAYARLEQEVPCLHIEQVSAAFRIEGGLRQAFIDLPAAGEVFIDNMSASAKAVAKESIQLGSGKRVIERESARTFVKSTGVDQVLRTEAY